MQPAKVLQQFETTPRNEVVTLFNKLSCVAMLPDKLLYLFETTPDSEAMIPESLVLFVLCMFARHEMVLIS